MCICKQRTPSRKSTTTTTTTATSTAAAAAAAAAAATPRTNCRRPLLNKGMPPPHAKPATRKRSASQDQQLHHVTQDPEISLAQVSNILDPFFDTCIAAVRRQRQQQRSQAAASATAAAATAAATAATHKFLTPLLHGADSVSVVRDDAGDSGDMGQGDAVCSASSATAAASDSGGALQDFLGSGNSAWVDMVQEMEAEKQQHDQQQQVVRLNVILP